MSIEWGEVERQLPAKTARNMSHSFNCCVSFLASTQAPLLMLPSARLGISVTSERTGQGVDETLLAIIYGG